MQMVDEENSSNVQNKMNQLLMLSDDPKIYYQAMEELKDTERDRGNFSQDHLFDDKYIVSEKNFR